VLTSFLVWRFSLVEIKNIEGVIYLFAKTLGVGTPNWKTSNYKNLFEEEEGV